MPDAAALDAPRTDPRLVDHLRADLTATRWDVETVEEALGPVATAALRREQAVAARIVLEGSTDPVAVLTDLLVLGTPRPRGDVDRALPRLGVDGAVRLGLLDAAGAGPGDAVRARVDLRPYRAEDASGTVDWWLASDLGELAIGRPLREDHVLGIGGASLTLARLTVRTPRRRTLDLGTGCGIQALHASRHSDVVVATDVSRRALAFTNFNAALAGLAPDRVELRHGSLLAPVDDGEVDLVVSNPPFVITPPGVPRYEYRDAGMVGDDVVAQIVQGVGRVLAPGGLVQILGNWEHRHGEDWDDRVTAWLDASGLDGWVVQREVQDPAEYAEIWLRDGGTTPSDPGWAARYTAWLEDFENRGVEAVGFGFIVLRRPDGAPTLRRVEEVTSPVRRPLGEHFAAALAAHDWLTTHDDDALLAHRLRVAPDVTEERHLRPGATDPTVVRLRQGGGFGRTVRVGTALAGVVGACDGELVLGDLVGGVAALLDLPVGELTAEILPQVRGLVGDGLLLV